MPSTRLADIALIISYAIKKPTFSSTGLRYVNHDSVLRHRKPDVSQMAPVSRTVSVCLLFCYIVSMATASPRALADPGAITGTKCPVNPAPLTPTDLTDTGHTKRELPPLGRWQDHYALPHGWSVTVSALSMFMSFGTQAAANWFDSFYWRIQVACAANMLNNSPCGPQVIIIEGPWVLVLHMQQQSTVQEIKWSFVYYFAMYMRNWVLNGFTGTGAVRFTHTSGINLVGFLVNKESSGGSVLC